MANPTTPRNFSKGLYSSRNADKFVIRLKEDMRAQITERAKEANCSMNSWIIHRLEQILNDEHPLAWTPAVNAPVRYNDLVFVIKGFDMDGSGDLVAEIARRDSEGKLVELHVPVTDLKPFKIV